MIITIAMCTIAIATIHLFHDNYYRFTPEEKAKRPQQCYMPFGVGPRYCVGMRLARLQKKIVFIELLKRFTFLRASDTEVITRCPFIMNSFHGLSIGTFGNDTGDDQYTQEWNIPQSGHQKIEVH